MSIKIRRGTNADRLTVILDWGELGYTTDTKKLYVGDNTTLGGNEVGGGAVTAVTGVSPIASTGGTTPAISIADSVADGSTKGAAAFSSSDFNSSAGVISIDYSNGQSASAANKGFLTASDWSAFNGKEPPITPGTTGQYWRGDKSWQTLNKSAVGLGNVDNVQQMPLSYLDTDPTLAANSDSKVPSQKAIKTYADNLINAANALVYKGAIDCSANPNYPAANAGDLYLVSVAGKIGGASGFSVEVGDMCICTTDGTPSGNQATVGANWNIIQKNIDGAVVGPASSTNNNVVLFDGTSGKVIKDSGLSLSGSNTGDETNATIKTKLGAASGSQDGYLTLTDWSTFNNKQNALGYTPEDVANKQTNLAASATKYPTVDAVNTGLSTKENSITSGATSQYWRGDKSWQTLDKTAVGLSNVDNTSDVNKPISSATQTALDGKQKTITSGTAAPSGGADGDIYLQYT